MRGFGNRHGPRKLFWFIAGLLFLNLGLHFSTVGVRADTLTVHMITNQEGYRYMVDHMIPEFERQHDVIVDLVRVSWSDRMERLIINTAAGIPPDVARSGSSLGRDRAGGVVLN